MDRGEIIAALTALAGELEGRGVVAEMYVVGGAAIALAFDERRATSMRSSSPRMLSTKPPRWSPCGLSCRRVG
jgi:hypothetical protein